MRLLFALAMLIPQVLALSITSGEPTSPTLQSLQGRYRPLLIFSPSGTLPAFVTQSGILTNHAAALAERDLVVVSVLLTLPATPIPESKLKHLQLGPKEQAEARRQHHVDPDSFTVLLLGKDGGEKLRSHTVLSFQQLRDTIDAMPMRQHEMHHSR